MADPGFVHPKCIVRAVFPRTPEKVYSFYSDLDPSEFEKNEYILVDSANGTAIVRVVETAPYISPDVMPFTCRFVICRLPEVIAQVMKAHTRYLQAQDYRVRQLNNQGRK